MLFFYSVPFRDPCGVAREKGIDILVSQIPGGDRRLLARLSGGTPAVEDEMRPLVRRELLGNHGEFVRRNIHRAGNMAVPELILGPRIDEKEGRMPINELLELLGTEIAYAEAFGRRRRDTGSAKQH